MGGCRAEAKSRDVDGDDCDDAAGPEIQRNDGCWERRVFYI
jgi:hypothetical protein